MPSTSDSQASLPTPTSVPELMLALQALAIADANADADQIDDVMAERLPIVVAKGLRGFYEANTSQQADLLERLLNLPSNGPLLDAHDEILDDLLFRQRGSKFLTIAISLLTHDINPAHEVPFVDRPLQLEAALADALGVRVDSVVVSPRLIDPNQRYSNFELFRYAMDSKLTSEQPRPKSRQRRVVTADHDYADDETIETKILLLHVRLAIADANQLSRDDLGDRLQDLINGELADLVLPFTYDIDGKAFGFDAELMGADGLFTTLRSCAYDLELDQLQRAITDIVKDALTKGAEEAGPGMRVMLYPVGVQFFDEPPTEGESSPASTLFTISPWASGYRVAFYRGDTGEFLDGLAFDDVLDPELFRQAMLQQLFQLGITMVNELTTIEAPTRCHDCGKPIFYGERDHGEDGDDAGDDDGNDDGGPEAPKHLRIVH